MKRSRRYRFAFPVLFALTYVLMTQSVWLPLKETAPHPGHLNLDDQAFFFGIWRILSVLVLFVLSMPFIPAIRQWEAPVVGGLTGVVVSVYDWQLWWGISGFGGSMALFSWFVVPLFACASIVVFLRYAEGLWRRRLVAQ
ncbi:MAG: hypothetical protein WBX03_10365 [Terriglobales bacterium]|jgi:hypothetical protein